MDLPVASSGAMAGNPGDSKSGSDDGKMAYDAYRLGISSTTAKEVELDELGLAAAGSAHDFTS